MIWNQADREFVYLTLGFKLERVQMGEKTLLALANELNREERLVKTVLGDNCERVQFGVGLLCKTHEDFAWNFRRLIDALDSVANDFFTRRF